MHYITVMRCVTCPWEGDRAEIFLRALFVSGGVLSKPFFKVQAGE